MKQSQRIAWLSVIVIPLFLTACGNGNNSAPLTTVEAAITQAETTEASTTLSVTVETTTVSESVVMPETNTVSVTTPEVDVEVSTTVTDMDSESTTSEGDAEQTPLLVEDAEQTNVSAENVGGNANSTELEIVSYTPSTGEAVDTGSIRAVCPEGWTFIPRKDYFSSEENALDPNNLFLMKGGSDTLEPNPFVSITFYGANNVFFMTLEEEKKFYGDGPDSLTDISFRLGEDVWVGFSFTVGTTGEEVVLRNQSTQAYTVGIRVKDINGSISLTEDDVMTILSSIQYES